jgi:hypothetical protein
VIPLVRPTALAILRCLDWLVSVAERLIVLGLSGLVFHFGYHVWRGTLSADESKILPLLGQNWKIIFVLMVPLFYQTIRTFLEEVQEFWGMTRPKKGASQGEEKTTEERS